MEAGYDLKPNAEAMADGLEVSRELLDEQLKPITELKVGQSVIVKIQLRNISPEHQDNIALTDLMPGGFEIANKSLMPGVNAMQGADYVDIREDRNLIYTRLAEGQSQAFQYSIKPIAAGDFVLPSVYAESMYDPSFKGQSRAGRVVVKAAE
jgi:alpha-2-macroglobulin